MKTAIIVQARMTSTRLPGKVMLDLGGHTVLAHVLQRCAAVPGVDTVCCAIPAGADHEPVVSEAERAGVSIFRGSEGDVLDRYCRAARALSAKVVMRVTSDCPLIDPVVCGRVIRLLTEEAADYASNNMPPSWPQGLDCEAFTIAALERAAESARQPDEREHVTPWLRKHPDMRKANLAGPGGNSAELRWTLDYQEDYEFLARLFRELPPWPATPTTEEVLAILASHPEIPIVNRRYHGAHGPFRPAAPKEVK